MVTIGVIGAGYWGTNVVRTFQNMDGCSLKYVADTRPGRREFIAKNFPQTQVIDDYKTILQDPEIDAVSIVTPVETHFEIAREAILAGKHIYVEKPFTHKSESAAALVSLAKDHNVKILVGHLFEYHPVVEKVKTLIDEGCIGDIYLIEARRMNLRPPETKYNVIWDLGPHDFSIINMLLGESPQAVSANAHCFVKPDLIDNTNINLKYTGNRHAQVNLNWLTPNKTRELCVYGTNGVMVYNDIEPVDKIRIYGLGIDTRIGADAASSHALGYKPGDIRIPTIPGGQPLEIECRHFIDAVRDDSAIKSDGEDGLNVVRMIELANNSILNDGRWLSFAS